MHERDPQEERVPMEIVQADDRLIPNKNVTRAIKAVGVASYLTGGLIAVSYVFDETPKLIRTITDGIPYESDFGKQMLTILSVFIFYLAGSFADELIKIRTEKTNYIKNINESHSKEEELIKSTRNTFE